MYKLIVSDLDETLLNSQKHISKKDIESINSLKDCKFVIATGRGVNDIDKELMELGKFNIENEYSISFNGGLITENKDNKVIYSNNLSFDNAKQLFNIGLNYNICIEISCHDCVYCYNIFPFESEILTKGHFKFKSFNDKNIDFLKDHSIAKVLFCNRNMDYLRQIRNEIKLDNEYSMSYSSNRYLEINPKGIDKGSGLELLCKVLNIDIKDTIAVGDSLNDLSMIKKAGLGIGVKNSTQDIIPYCDIILDSTNNEDPITELIDRFIKKTL